MSYTHFTAQERYVISHFNGRVGIREIPADRIAILRQSAGSRVERNHVILQRFIGTIGHMF